MIKTREDLNRCLMMERAFYWADYPTTKRALFFKFTRQHQYELWRYVRLLRICEYLLNSTSCRAIKMMLFWLYERRRNNLGNRLGLCIAPNVFDEGLFIDHIGSIVVNPYARVGKCCHIHGDCCIGNNGFNNEVPVIGDHVDIGWGAILIGGIRIADHVKIGANAVVNRSVETAGAVCVGVPAKEKE